jgi:hypothetical protein
MIKSESITRCDGCDLGVTKYFSHWDHEYFKGWAEVRIVGGEIKHYCPECWKQTWEITNDAKRLSEFLRGAVDVEKAIPAPKGANH